MANKTIVVRIGGDASGFKKAADETVMSMDRIGGFAKKMAASLAAIGAVEVFRRMTAEGLAFADSQAKLARRLDSTIDSVRAVQLAAGRAGLDIGAMSDVMDRLNRSAGEAANDGAAKSAEAFKNLRINIEDFTKLEAHERLALIADRIDELGLSGAQTADLIRDFGIRNQEAIEILRGGGDVIRRAREEVDEFGLSLSEVDAAMIERANDAMDDMKLIVESLSTKFAVSLSPALAVIAENFNEMQKEGKDFKDDFDLIVEAIVFGAGAAANSVLALSVSFMGVATASVGAFAVAGQAALALDKQVGGILGRLGGWMENLTVEQKAALVALNPILNTNLLFFQSLTKNAEEATHTYEGMSATLDDLLKKFYASGGFVGTGEEWAESFRKMREAMDEDARRSDGERELAKHIKNLDELKARYMSGEIKTVAEFHTQLESLEAGHAKRMAQIRSGGGNGEGFGAGAVDTKAFEAVQKQVAALRESVRSDEERELVRHLENLDALKAGYLAGEFENVAEFHGLMQSLEIAHNERMAEIEAGSPEAKFVEQLQGKLEALQHYLKTEAELEREQFRMDLDTLKLSLENKLITEEEYMADREQLWSEHLERLLDINKRHSDDTTNLDELTAKERASINLGYLQSILGAVDTNSKAMFNIMKSMAIAQAIIDHYASIQSAYKWGSAWGGPPAGAAMAAIAAAATIAPIASIKQTNINSKSHGGGGISSGGASGSTASGSGNTGAQGGGSNQSVTIAVHGQIFDRASVLSLIKELNDAVADGAKITVQ